MTNLISVIGGADGPTAYFVAGSLGSFWVLMIPCILLVFVQYKLCKNEKKWVKLSMLILAGVMALLVFLNVISGYILSFLIGGFVALIMLIMAVCLAICSGLGWLIYYIMQKRK